MKQFLLVGKSGVGKSSFVNASFGVELARCDSYEPCTKLAETYTDNTEFGALSLIDTPGLADNCRHTDLRYLRLIKKVISDKDTTVLLFLARLDDKRFRGEDKSILRLITEELGASVWENSWLVFTFCAEVPTNELDEAADVRIAEIEKYLKSLKGNSSFSGFEKYILMDNVKKCWHPDASIITANLCKE